MNDPVLFALAVLVLLAVPGPTNTLLAGSGLTRGIARSLPLLLGEFAGYAIAIAVYRNVLGPVVSETGGAQIALQLAIAAYLVFLAVRLWRVAPGASAAAFTLPRVFVATLLNPKALIFALLIFPAPPAPIAVHAATFSALVVVVGTVWILAGSLITRLTQARYSLVAPRLCAVALVVFAIVIVANVDTKYGSRSPPQVASAVDEPAVVPAGAALPTRGETPAVALSPASSAVASPGVAVPGSDYRPAEVPLAEPYAAPGVHLREIARLAVDPGAYDAPPAIIGRWAGADIVVENICSTNCPLDTQQVIHFDVPQGQSCEQLQGVEQAMLTRTRSGRFEDRVFCIPNSLAQN